ncbi:MAG: hypothetical protein NC079_07240 [Clostridium sp.]|nr:hypothetical protein [Acetatifactor muris]MCM1527667.1 hypothetical protein [Bacteroides sp.]MCM1563389.1 hypothetical protein [Clostridium sp.]
MKVIKSIGLFFVFPATMLFLGFVGGVRATHFFYPGEDISRRGGIESESGAEGTESAEESGAPKDAATDGLWQVSRQRESLSADTEYVLYETDILRETEVETVWKLPGQYIGMDRERFLSAMKNYEDYPPLSELERGFVSLEVLSFSPERVEVRMNYRYVQPGEGFYLTVQNHEVVVCLEDRKTVYINTGILLESLPEELQLAIIDMLYVEEEGELYSLLESYSS